MTALPRDVAHTALTLEGWTEGRPLGGAVREPAGAWKRTPFSETGTIAISPDGAHWASEAAFPDSGELDVVLHDRSGASRRLTFARGDDRPAAFSPDGTLLAIATARWNANGHSNLALIDARTGALIRRLTQGDSASEFAARWSPDGSRLAFTRTVAGGDSSVLCWVTMDARRERCVGLAPWRAFRSHRLRRQLALPRARHERDRGGNVSTSTWRRPRSAARAFPPPVSAMLDATGRWLLLASPDTAGSATIRRRPGARLRTSACLSLPGRSRLPASMPGSKAGRAITSRACRSCTRRPPSRSAFRIDSVSWRRPAAANGRCRRSCSGAR